MKIELIERVKYDGTYHDPGEVIDAKKPIAEDLIKKGAARRPRAEEPQKETAAELIEKIQAAATLAELEALVSRDEDRSTVIAAYEARFAELDGDPDGAA